MEPYHEKDEDCDNCFWIGVILDKEWNGIEKSRYWVIWMFFIRQWNDSFPNNIFFELHFFEPFQIIMFVENLEMCVCLSVSNFFEFGDRIYSLWGLNLENMANKGKIWYPNLLNSAIATSDIRILAFSWWESTFFCPKPCFFLQTVV